MVLVEPVDVGSVNVPFLIGLDLLDRYHMVINNVGHVLMSPNLRCKKSAFQQTRSQISRIGEELLNAVQVLRTSYCASKIPT